MDAIVNVTGPDSNPRRSACPLGAVAAQPGRLHRTNWDLVGKRINSPSIPTRKLSGVHQVGPLLRARHWEATAVPERRHVDRTAAQLRKSLATGAGSYFRKLAAPVLSANNPFFLSIHV